MNIQQFCIKVQKEFKSSPQFNVSDFHEGAIKSLLRVKDFTWIGIGETEKEAKERCVEKAIKFFEWEANEE